MIEDRILYNEGNNLIMCRQLSQNPRIYQFPFLSQDFEEATTTVVCNDYHEAEMTGFVTRDGMPPASMMIWKNEVGRACLNEAIHFIEGWTDKLKGKRFSLLDTNIKVTDETRDLKGRKLVKVEWRLL